MDADVAELLDAAPVDRPMAWTMAQHGGASGEHKPGTPEHAAWMSKHLGHAVAQEPMYANTLEARARTRQAFEAAGYGHKDPAAEVLGDRIESAHPSRHVHAVGGFAGFMVQITNEIEQQFQAALERMIHQFHQIDWEDLAARLQGLGDAQAEQRAASRRRHGKAAVCPIHGPTRGGICRTCSRSHR